MTLAKSRPILLGVIAALVVLGAVAGCGSEPEPIKIGVILPLSGSLKSSGEAARDGMILAADEINDRGGMNGRLIELVVEDGSDGPEKARQAFTRLEKEHQPLFYISVRAPITDALRGFAQVNEVMLFPVSTDVGEEEAMSGWTFQHTSRPGVSRALTLALRALLDKLNVNSLGYISANVTFAKFHLEEVKELFDGNIRAIGVDRSELDFSGYIEELFDTDALYILGLYAPQTLALLSQLKQAGYQGTVISSLVSPLKLVTLLSAQGTYYLAPIIYNPDYLFASEFISSYESRFDKPFNDSAAISYDIMHIFADLMEGEELTRENLRQVLNQGFSYSGVFGEVNARPGARHITFGMHVTQVVNGKLEYR